MFRFELGIKKRLIETQLEKTYLRINWLCQSRIKPITSTAKMVEKWKLAKAIWKRAREMLRIFKRFIGLFRINFVHSTKGYKEALNMLLIKQGL